MTPRAIVDTGPIVALLDRRDGWHAWAKKTFDELDAPLGTCEAVLSEACFLLRRAKQSPDLVLGLVEAGVLAPDFVVRQEVRPLRATLTRYANLPASLADACLVRMAELRPGAPIVTLDRDFLVYRGRGRRRFPLIAPFVE